jgi:hypothetical protein
MLKNMHAANEKDKTINSLPVVAASYLGPALVPNSDGAWDEAKLPANPDDLVQKMMGQPMRRAGRFIKLVCCGALACMSRVPEEKLRGRSIGIFLATGLGNIDEILPFITQVFKHDGGFPSPNQFANSVSNAAAFFLAKFCGIQGVVLTVSQEELSFESALWLAQSYLAAGEIDLALVGGCDVFTPSVEDYRERLNLVPGRYRRAPLGENSSWLLLGGDGKTKIGDILTVEISSGLADAESLPSDDLLDQCEKLFAELQHKMESPDNSCNPTLLSFPRKRESSLSECLVDSRLRGNDREEGFFEDDKISKLLLPGFRLSDLDEALWQKNGWDMDDYLIHCGISSTASACGLARALLSRRRTFLVHENLSSSGRRALIAAVTK